MSSGVKGAAAAGRVSIPSSVKKTIENIKEIVGQSHGEDEIYAMLKECSMDPNETAQKLLLLDTFREVKKKRDRRKENLSKEAAESKWKPGSQTWGNRASRGNYSSRQFSHDAGGGTNLSTVKESATSYISEKGVRKALAGTSQDIKKNEGPAIARTIVDVSNGPSGMTRQSINSIVPASEGVNQSAVDSIKKPDPPATRKIQQNEMLDSSTAAMSLPSTPALGSHFSSMDPVLLPSQNFSVPSAVGAIRREVESQRTPVELVAENLTERQSDSSVQQKMSNDLGVEKTESLESPQNNSSTTGASVSRPSSNYNNRSQVAGPQKVGPSKEWKPKSTNPSVGQGATTVVSSEVSSISIGSHPEPQQTPSQETTVKLQGKLEELNISNSQHVIIPNHLHVPDAGKLGFCFGSFDASFGVDTTNNVSLGCDKSPPPSESSEASDQPVKEMQLSNQTVLEASDNTEMKYSDHVESLPQGPERFSSGEVEVSPSVDRESKLEVTPGSDQHPVVHASSYNYGFMPPILSGPLAPFESSEPQARDAPRLPGFVVQQSFDPASYYAQFYRSGMDTDGRISPLHSAGAANKYNGNAAVASAQASQSPQELQGGAPLVLSTASPVPLITQTAGVMQSPITANQQPLPIFRQPTGVHLPHYPPFIPYAPYFSPFYAPHPAIHQFFSNAAFPQQPQGSSLYPNQPGTTSKYSVSQHKQGSNTGSSTHPGMPSNYGPYGLSTATAAAAATSNEDIGAPQVKENNIYVNAQQSEGSGVSQGQLAFTPSHPSHGTIAGIFHPAQAGSTATVHPLLQQNQAITNPVDMVGSTPSVYHHHQHPQLNWPSNY